MNYLVLLTIICLATVANAQITWFKASLSCSTTYSTETINEYSHFVANQKLLVQMKKDGHMYANSAPCESAENCNTDMKLTASCVKLGATTNYASLSAGGATPKISTKNPSGGDANDYCTVPVLILDTPIVVTELDKCAKAQRKVAADNTATSDVAFQVVVADKDCTANAASAVVVSTTCVLLPSFGSAMVKDSLLTLYPGDLKCGVVAESDKITIPSEATCVEYVTGKYGKYVVTDSRAVLSYECTDNACSSSCTTQNLDKDKCTAVTKGSMLFGSLGLSGGAIAGIVIGTILGIALIAGIVIVVVKKSGGASSSAV